MMKLAVRDDLIAGLTEGSRQQLLTYRELLFRWNQRFNLTAIREREGIDTRLIGDALRLLPSLDSELRTRGRRVRLIDIGAGAGVPGLVLKIARPEIDITLVDATNKKIQFVQYAIAELGLARARTVHGRAEDLGQIGRASCRDRLEG